MEIDLGVLESAVSVVMANRKQEIPPAVQLDVDWLVGRRADPRHVLPAVDTEPLRRVSPNLLGASIGIATSLFVFFCWPTFSHRWLEFQSASFAMNSVSPLDESEMLVALEMMSESEEENLVNELAHEQPERRRNAFRSLANRIDALRIETEPVEAWLKIAKLLNTASLPDPDSQELKSLLIEQIAALSSSESDSFGKRALDSLCYSMLPRSDWHGILQFDQTSEPWVFEEDLRGRPPVYQLTDIDKNLAPSSWGAGSGWTNSNRNPSLNSMDHIVGLGSSLNFGSGFDRGMETSFKGSIVEGAIDNQIPLPHVPPPDLEGIAAVKNLMGHSSELGIVSDDVVSNTEMRPSLANTPVALVSRSSLSLNARSSDSVTPEDGTIAQNGSDQFRDSNTHESHLSSSKRNVVGRPQLLFQGNRGSEPAQVMRVETKSLFDLLSSLQSEQDVEVRNACEELFRRRIPTDVVDLALALAREEGPEKLELVELVVRLDSSLSLPMLHWLARTGDHLVRYRAIAMLGAMQDIDARQILRNLSQRESDPRLQQVIHKSLNNGGLSRQTMNVGVQ